MTMGVLKRICAEEAIDEAADHSWRMGGVGRDVQKQIHFLLICFVLQASSGAIDGDCEVQEGCCVA